MIIVDKQTVTIKGKEGDIICEFAALITMFTRQESLQDVGALLFGKDWALLKDISNRLNEAVDKTIAEMKGND